MNTSRVSMLLPVAGLCLAGIAGLGAWLVLGGSRDPLARTSDPTVSEDHAAPATIEVPASLEPTGSAEEARPDRRKAAARVTDAELAAASWVEGRLIFPAGTPSDEVVEVVAGGRKFRSGARHRARLEADGSFRVAFAEGATTGTLDVDGRYLFLKAPLAVKLVDGKPEAPVVLEPLLGGVLRGRLVLPPGAQALAAELAGQEIGIYGSDLKHQESQQRITRLDASLGFEMRALSPSLGHRLYFDSGLVPALAIDGLRFAAGAVESREFPLPQGVRLRGRVRDSDGAVPPHVEIAVREQPFGKLRSGVAPDGSIDLRGIVPGKVELRVRAPQRLPVSLDLGEMTEGETREGLEIVMPVGERIAGTVTWPDGSPAAGARLAIRALDPRGAADAPGSIAFLESIPDVRADAAGAFSVSGLLPGKHSIFAEAKAREAKEKQGARAPAWSALLAEVDAGDTGVRVELGQGLAVRGVVVDDAGQPVERFRVSAMELPSEDGSTRRPGPHRRWSESFDSKDGRFELTGFDAGRFSLVASAGAHEPSAPSEIAMPATAVEVQLVVVRNGGVRGTAVLPDGAPAAGAKVKATVVRDRVRDEAEATANARGEFRLVGLAPGEAEIRARLDGFAPSLPWTMDIAPGGSAADVRLVLRAGGTIVGQCVASAPGEELGGREVGLRSVEGGEIQGDRTDASGGFVIEHVEPGEYAVWVDPPEAELIGLVGSNSERLWEARKHLRREATVQVADGATTRVTVGPKGRTGLLLSGVVLRGSAPAAEVRVRCTPAERPRDGEERWALTDAGGRFEFDLPRAGTYDVTLQPNRDHSTVVECKLEVPETGSREVELRVFDGRIAGKVRLPDGAVVPYVSHSLRYFGGSIPADALKLLPSIEMGTDFEFTDLPGGRYLLELEATEQTDSHDLLREYRASRELRLDEGGALVGLEIPFLRPGSLALVIAGAESGHVRVRRAESGPGIPWDFEQFADGRLEYLALEPGIYDVAAEARPGLCCSSQRVEIVSEKRASVTLSLQPGACLEVQMLHSGRIALDATARIHDPEGRESGPGPLLHGQVACVAPGQHRVTATTASGDQAQTTTTARAGSTKVVLLRFP